MKAAENTAPKQRGKPFQKGMSGNPSGRPIGHRNRATLAVESLLDGQAERLTQKAVEMALEGDTTALRLCLERICPARKDRVVAFDLPEIASVQDIATAIGALMIAVASGDVSPADGVVIAGLLERHGLALADAKRAERAAMFPEWG